MPVELIILKLFFHGQKRPVKHLHIEIEQDSGFMREIIPLLRSRADYCSWYRRLTGVPGLRIVDHRANPSGLQRGWTYRLIGCKTGGIKIEATLRERDWFDGETSVVTYESEPLTAQRVAALRL